MNYILTYNLLNDIMNQGLQRGVIKLNCRIESKIQELIGAPNEKNIIQYLILNTDSSRTTIKQALSVSMATVTNVTENLIKKKLIKENGLQKIARGRSSISLTVNKEKFKAIGIGITKNNVSVELIDLSGNSYYQKIFDTDFISFEKNIDNIVQGIKSILKEVDNENDIIGIGLALPGFVEYNFENLDQQLITTEWDTEKIVSRIEKEFAFGVVVASASTVALSGEVYFGCATQSQNVLYVNVSSGGLGWASIKKHIINQDIDKNVRSLGHTMINITKQNCICGQTGCLELYVNKYALQDNYKKNYHINQELYSDEETSDFIELGYKDIFKLEQSGDITAIQAVTTCATILGYSLYNLKIIMNPDLIVLGGNMVDQSELFFKTTANIVNQKLKNINQDACIFSSRKINSEMLQRNNVIINDSIAVCAATIVFENFFR